VPEKVAAGYLASLSPLKKAQLVLAFSRALHEAEFFPVPALLRSFGSIGNPVMYGPEEEPRTRDGSEPHNLRAAHPPTPFSNF
jgi:hypothetical protein